MMKIIKYIPVFLMIAAAGACSDDINVIEDQEGSIRVSTPGIYFDAQGGKRTIAVSSSVNGWEIATSPEQWLNVTQDANSVTLSTGANGEGGARFQMIKISATQDGATVSDSVYVYQSAAGTDSFIDLSAGGIANCYVAKTGGDYRIDAKLKGNGRADGDGNSGYIGNYGVEIPAGVYAVIIWEATMDGDRTRSREVTSGYPVYDDGHIYFSTGSRQGNAVIAVMDDTGEVLWSWHIWVTDEDYSTVEGRGFEWMDRNLGALTAERGNNDNRGLLYQWGRKDPQLPSAVLTANTVNSQVGKGSGEWAFMTMSRINTPPGNIPQSIKYPARIFVPLISSNSDWYAEDGEDFQINSYLWGDYTRQSPKTIFDPCPAGFTVPPAAAWWEYGQNTTLTTEWGAVSDYGREWTGGSGDYYPVTGYRAFASGNLMNSNTNGFYWTQTPVIPEDATNSTGHNRSYFLSYTATLVSYNKLGTRGDSRAIRCVKEYAL